MANLAEVLYVTGAVAPAGPAKSALQAPQQIALHRAKIRQSKKKQTNGNHGDGTDQYTLNRNDHTCSEYPS